MGRRDRLASLTRVLTTVAAYWRRIRRGQTRGSAMRTDTLALDGLDGLLARRRSLVLHKPSLLHELSAKLDAATERVNHEWPFIPGDERDYMVRLAYSIVHTDNEYRSAKLPARIGQA